MTCSAWVQVVAGLVLLMVAGVARAEPPVPNSATPKDAPNSAPANATASASEATSASVAPSSPGPSFPIEPAATLTNTTVPVDVTVEKQAAAPLPVIPPLEPPADARLEQARRIAQRAQALFSAENYGAALTEFSRANQVLEGHPRQYIVLNNIAVCHERMFRYDLAVRYYEAYLRRAPAGEPDRPQVVAVLRTLRTLLATLEVQSSVPTEIWVDDRKVGTGPGKVLIPSGYHSVELRAVLYEAQRLEIQAAAGQIRRIVFTPQRLSTYAGPPRAYFWVSLGLAGAAATSGTVLGVMTRSAHEDGRAKAELHLDTRREAERARALAFAADASFGGALLFGAAALVLHVVSEGTPDESLAKGSQSSRLRLRVELNARQRNVAVFGAF